jgi:hypothetical protein
MVGTYLAALVVIGASVPIGAAVLVLSGRRQWSWLAPALGLAAITVVAWLLVRLPGEGLTALLGILALAGLSGGLALPRLERAPEQVVAGAPTAVLTLLAVSIPFAVEGHFGVLGTGFNVDMSQHLFTAEWVARPLASAPPLIDQGYPVGPHSLAVAGAELPGGGLVLGFTGMSIAVPVVGGLTALAGTRQLGSVRGTIAAVLVAVPYLVASYLAQGSFKELFEAFFLLAFALWLHELSRTQHPGRTLPRGALLPGAVLAAGALYAYSGPGLAWLLGTLGIWALLELATDRAAARATARAALPAIAIALLALGVLIAPEAGRIADFGGSAGNVANAGDSEPRGARELQPAITAQAGVGDAGGEAAAEPEQRLDLFNNDLGNLFGDVPALEVFGVWPSGDFRVEPGDGSIPAPLFYVGALLGAAALLVGLRLAIRRRETALLAALAAALIIWLAALLLSTPYTAAKALQLVAPVLMLISVRGVLDPEFSPLPGGGSTASLSALAPPLLAVAFVVATAGSSALALANAPVGPERYSAGLTKLRPLIAGEPVLMLAPAGQLSERHGADFYGWELRGARPICVEPFPAQGTGFDRPAPAGIRYVLTLGGKDEAPFDDVEEVSRRRRVALWEVDGYRRDTAPDVAVNPDVPTDCALSL